MDYFNDVLPTFLGLDRGSSFLSKQGQRALRIHQKCLNLCPKMNEGLTGLERHEGE